MLALKIDEIKEHTKDISVLYVEDNELARKKTTKILSRVIKDLDVAEDGQEALYKYMSKKYDLVISDIVMPNLNGLELVKSIKKLDLEQKVIFVSAYTEMKFLMDAIELGVDSFVFKPLNNDRLNEVLVKICKQINTVKESLKYKENLENVVKERTKELEDKNKELLEMIDEVKKSRYLKEEMKIAQRVQENFLPKEVPITNKIKIASYFKAAKYVGGDYYDYFFSDESILNIVIADVSGHGVGPAINMSTFRSLCQIYLKSEDDFPTQIKNINKMVCQDSRDGSFFITAFFIKYYKKEDKISYISAGHNDMLFYKTKSKNIEYLKSTSIPLGIFDSTEFEEVKREIESDDTLLLYTDGMIECENDMGEMFELDRVKEVFEENIQKGAKEILEILHKKLDDFTGKLENKDDTTIVISKFV